MILSAAAASLVASFKTSLQQDQACLHPTDTLPGLTFHPCKEHGLATLRAFKRRPEANPFISLVSGLEAAVKFWEPLPDGWYAALCQLWPASLSVIWRAGPNAPANLVSSAGKIALRTPVWSPETAWMQQLLHEFALPLPSTSVNISGEPPATSWQDAKKLIAASSQQIFVPDFTPQPSTTPSSPSTVIEITSPKDFIIRREGRISQSHLETLLKSL